ncbi:hypothetical protein GCM10009682_43250 [Luedemannella flava]|uniref:SHOCT domain-containing protein n=2 Tax=Luedemannella flava TaxID=349316 RepID=A0ABP4YKT0_9ACTN
MVMLRRPVVVRRGPGLLGTVARTAVIAGTATATSNAITAHQQRRHAESAAAQQAAYEGYQASRPQPAAATGDLTAELGKLAALRESGALTEEEFAAAKARLLGT